jgi:hypothetical protein
MSIKRYINKISLNESEDNNNDQGYDIIEYYKKYYNERAYYNRIIGLDID